MKKFISLLIIMSLGLFVGCSSGINFNISYDKKGGFGIKEVDGETTMDILEYVNSLEELNDLCDEWDNPSFNENSEHYSNEVSKKIRSYDEDYFKENIIVIYSFWRGHKTETRIDSIEVIGERLVINTRYRSKRGTFDDVAFNWLILIEINKADVEGISSIHVKHK